MIGRQLSHFYVIRSLGSGGMGTVYEAQDTRLPRSVAIKFLNAGLARNVRAIRRFKREARLASSLNHPNICTVLDVDEGDGHPFIAMELLIGASLKERLKAGPMAMDEILDIAVQVSDALAAAHAQGIMHRDVTPGNIFLTNGGVVKMLDFGLAKHFAALGDDGDVTEELTETGTLAGTLHYMAPEQFADVGEVDHRCDLFSLGAVLYQMMTGSRPFQAKSRDETIALICQQPHVPVRQLAPHYPLQVERTVDRLLAKHPRDRYQTASALRADLDGARSTRGRTLQRSERDVEPWTMSVAVLPFHIIGATSPLITEFRDGLAEEISSRFNDIPHVRVAPQTSTRAALDRSIHEIGTLLNVQMVVEGSVQLRGTRIKIIAKLIDVASEHSLVPSMRIARSVDDLLQAQEDVASDLVSRIAPALTRLPGFRYSVVPEALQAYKRGQQHWKMPFSGAWRTAIEQFQYAIERDERFAAAHVAVGAAYNFLGFYSLLKPNVAFQIAHRSLERALEIDETCASAYAELGLAKFGGDWDWEGSELDYRRALQLDPRCSVARVYYSWLLVLLGRDDAGLAEAETAYEQARSSRFIAAGRAQALYLAHRYDAAIAVCNECLSAHPDYPFALHLRAQCCRELSMHEQAQADLEHAAALANRAPFYLGVLGYWYGRMAMQAELHDVLAELDRQSGITYVPPQCYVYIYAGLGERQKALEYQEKAYEDGASPLNYLTPFIRDLYALDPHQQKRLEQMRLVL